MKMPNFFKYNIYSNGVKVGNAAAPCKRLVIFTLKTSGVYGMFPNITIKSNGLNI